MYIDILYIYIYIYIYIYNIYMYIHILYIYIYIYIYITQLKKLIGIKSPNTKQCPAKFFFAPVKLSSVMGGKLFSPKRR